MPELREYRSLVTEPDDFDEFWEDTLADARRYPDEPRRGP
ncbi:acetylxylan esterase [Cryobacterium sp. 10S3]